MTSQPLILAHRGASGTKPENTMLAFHQAIKDQADGFELDVFLSRDGHVVVTHDENTKRLTGHHAHVRKSTLGELRKLDFGNKEQIPTLNEVFEEFLPQCKLINVEIKSTGITTDGIEKSLARIIEDHNAEKKILVSSFNPLNLLRFRKILPEVKIGLLLCEEQNILARHPVWVRVLKPDTFNLHFSLLKHRDYAGFVNSGTPLCLWTANTQREFEACLHRHTFAIITNFPKQARKWAKK